MKRKACGLPLFRLREKTGERVRFFPFALCG